MSERNVLTPDEARAERMRERFRAIGRDSADWAPVSQRVDRPQEPTRLSLFMAWVVGVAICCLIAWACIAGALWLERAFPSLDEVGTGMAALVSLAYIGLSIGAFLAFALILIWTAEVSHG